MGVLGVVFSGVVAKRVVSGDGVGVVFLFLRVGVVCWCLVCSL